MDDKQATDDDQQTKELDQQYALFRLWLISPQAQVNPHLGPEAMIEEAMWMAWKEGYRYGKHQKNPARTK